MDNKLLFFDIDGTLVSFKTHQIPSSTIEALKKVHAQGHKIIIATGRPKAIINNIAEIEELVDGYITMNGSYCFAGEKVLFNNPIPAHDVEIVSRYCMEHSIPCFFVHEHDLQIAGDNYLSHEIFVNQLKVYGVPDVDYISPLAETVYQLTPFFDAETQQIIMPQTPACEYSSWHPAFVDITAKGNTKAHGIDVFVNFFNSSLTDTVAFGDGGNDIPMLRHAGVGVAMGNAADDVKQAANYVTSSVDDDGIFLALKHLGILQSSI